MDKMEQLQALMAILKLTPEDIERLLKERFNLTLILNLEVRDKIDLMEFISQHPTIHLALIKEGKGRFKVEEM